MNVGDQVLITCDNWFYAPDGQSYHAAWGTVRAVRQDSEVLGLKTNARSTNWYVELGNMIIAGCQIHYAVQCALPNFAPTTDDQGKEQSSRIFNADAQ